MGPPRGLLIHLLLESAPVPAPFQPYDPAEAGRLEVAGGDQDLLALQALDQRAPRLAREGGIHVGPRDPVGLLDLHPLVPVQVSGAGPPAGAGGPVGRGRGGGAGRSVRRRAGNGGARGAKRPGAAAGSAGGGRPPSGETGGKNCQSPTWGGRREGPEIS